MSYIDIPKPHVQIQNNLIELFLKMPSTKIAQMVLLHWRIGRQSSRWEMSLNDTFSWTADPNSK